MSASQTTTNYNLPVFEPTDIPAWLTDWNSAMGDIDTAIAGAKTAADTAQLTASGAANGVSTLNTTVGNLQTTVGNLGSTVTSLGNSLNTVQSLIGNGTPTTTDQTIIGAINEINAAYKDAANIEFDNTGTGMTATNVQAAIVEAYGHGGGGGSTAAAVSYDNTDSGLTATNVQDAIDELATNPASNVRYNETTDFLQCLVNGSWVNAIYLALKSFIIYLAGTFNYAMDLTTAVWPQYTNDTGHITKNANDITVNAAGFTNPKQAQFLISDSLLAVSGKKLKADYYLNNDTSNIQTVETSGVATADSYVSIGIYSGTQNDFYFVVEGDENALFNEAPTASGASVTLTSTDVVHVTKIYAE